MIDIKYKWLLSLNNLEQQLAQIVSDLQSKPDAGLIFLATHAPEGVKLVKLIREAEIKNPLIAPDSYAGKSFSQGFLNYPKEKLTPGYYTNGIYVSTPFLLDTANRQAHAFNTLYQKHSQQKPMWHAFYAVDAAMVLIEAIKQANALPFSFQASVFAKDIDVILDSVKRLNAKAVMVNDHTAFRVDWMPFGGGKTSGLGMGGIIPAMLDMTSEKMFVVKSNVL